MLNVLLLTACLPFQKIVELYTSLLKVSCPSKWYTFLLDTGIEEPSQAISLTLHSEFCIPVTATLNKDILHSVVSYQFSNDDIRKMWLATDSSTIDVTFG